MNRSPTKGCTKIGAIAVTLIGWSASGSLTSNWFAVAAASEAVFNEKQVAQATPTAIVKRPNLRLGSEGLAVSELQAALKLLGFYDGAVNSVYGDSTQYAVSQFQQAAGLEPDGMVCAETWQLLFPSTPATQTSSPVSASGLIVTKLNNAVSTSVDFPTLQLGMQGPAVERLQERLNTLGFFKGSVDGIFGLETQAAVKIAQEKFNLNPDGVVASATWRVLLR